MENKKILLTRAKGENKAFRELLEKRGDEAIELPMIEFSPVEDVTEIHDYLDKLDTIDWIVFTSVHAVEFFFQIAADYGVKFYFYPDLKVATVGEKTKLKLEQLGYRTNFVPIQYTAEVLAENMDENIKGKRVLIPRSNKASDEYLEVFRKRKAIPLAVTIYENRSVMCNKEEFRAVIQQQPDYLTFCSGSAFKAFHENLIHHKVSLNHYKIICIGPSTASVVKSLGYSVKGIAKTHTIEGLVETIEKIEKNV